MVETLLATGKLPLSLAFIQAVHIGVKCRVSGGDRRIFSHAMPLRRSIRTAGADGGKPLPHGPLHIAGWLAFSLDGPAWHPPGGAIETMNQSVSESFCHVLWPTQATAMIANSVAETSET
jgi:hypothetical protein